MDIINVHGGFTVVVWYLKGEINDKSFIGMASKIVEGQVDDGRMNYQIIKILPTNENMIKRGNKLNT